MAIIPGIQAAIGQIGSFVGEASKMEESMSKVRVVFGDSADQIVDWSTKSASAMGQSQQQALEAAGTYGNLFQAFGLGRNESAEMSTSLVQLAADLASFNNTSVDDAILALRSGLSGEAEPLKKYGIAITDARLKTEAFAMGLIESEKGALTPAAKAQASYSLIMKDSTLAQGDFARTSGGLANQQRILSANFTNLKSTIGTAMLPAVTALVSIFNVLAVRVMPLVQTGAEKIGVVIGALKGNLMSFVDNLVGFGKAGAPIESIGKNLAHLGSAFKSAFSGEGVTSTGAIGMFEKIGVAARDVMEAFRPLMNTLKNDLLPAFAAAGREIGGAFVQHLMVMAQAFMEVGREAAPLVATALQALADIVRALLPAITGIIKLVWEVQDTLIQWAVNSGMVGTALDGVKAIIQILKPIIEGLATVIANIVDWLSRHETVVKTLAVALGILLVALFPIPAAILALILVIGYLSNHWDDITAAIQGFINKVMEVPVLGQILQVLFATVQGYITDFVDYFRSIIEVAQEVISFFSNVFSGDWEAAWQDLKDIAMGVLEVFLNFLKLGFIDDVASALAGLVPWDYVKEAFFTFRDEIFRIGGIVLTWFQDLPGEVRDKLGNLLPILKQKGLDLLQGLWDGLIEKLRALGEWERSLPGQIKDFLGDVLPVLKQKGLDLIQGLWNGATELFTGFRTWVQGIRGQVQEIFFDAIRWLYNAGLDVVQGFWDGLKGKIGDVKEWGKENLNPLNWGGWHSPMADSMKWSGEQLGQAFVTGIEETFKTTLPPAVSKAIIENLPPAVEEAIGTSLGGAQTATERAGGQIGLFLGRSIGQAIADGMQVIITQVLSSGDLVDTLKGLRDVVGDLHGEMSRLLGLPTREAAAEELELAELRLERFKLETAAAKEAADREVRLGAMRAELAAARELEDDAAVASIEAKIDAIEASLGPNEKAIKQIDNEIDAVQRLIEQRKLEHDVLSARAQVADQTLIDDRALTEAAEQWIKRIFESTGAMDDQIGNIWTQYLPALEALKAAMYAAALQQAELNAAMSTPLGQLGASLTGTDTNARLGRALQSLGQATNQDFLQTFLESVAGGLSTQQSLSLLFSPTSGAFPAFLTQFKAALAQEGLITNSRFEVALNGAVAAPITQAVSNLMTAGQAQSLITNPITSNQMDIGARLQDMLGVGNELLQQSLGLGRNTLETMTRSLEAFRDLVKNTGGALSQLTLMLPEARRSTALLEMISGNSKDTLANVFRTALATEQLFREWSVDHGLQQQLINFLSEQLRVEYMMLAAIQSIQPTSMQTTVPFLGGGGASSISVPVSITIYGTADKDEVYEASQQGVYDALRSRGFIQ